MHVIAAASLHGAVSSESIALGGSSYGVAIPLRALHDVPVIQGVCVCWQI